MPSPTRSLTTRGARSLIRDHSFPAQTADRVGVEIEWFTSPPDAVRDVATLKRILEPVLPLPSGSALTFEPGAQLELSSLALRSCSGACAAVDADLAVIRPVLDAYGIGLTASGIDPHRSRRLRTQEPRYVAMREYFDASGTAGATMMCTTAAIHVNVDAGLDERGRDRWRLAHQLGPILVASFANSPIVDGRPSEWLSSRMAAWLAIDPTRTAPVPVDRDPAGAWATYALCSNVMFIRTPKGFVPITEPMSFAKWLEFGHELGHPTAEDLLYHLTTLFPPVRPRGWLELRMIDMVPDPWWRAAAALVTALLCDEQAAVRADAASEPASDLWTEAARGGLRHPVLAASAGECFRAALEATESIGCDAATTEALVGYYERFVARGRSPAEDDLDALRESTVAKAI